MKYRSEAGLECFIIRSDHGGCCKWCAALAGKYRYPEEVPKDVYRRHDNCTCTVTYTNGRKAQDVWSKTSRELPAEERERMREIGFKKPTISAEERERMLIAGMKKPQRLDIAGESGIIDKGIKVDMQYFSEKDIERQESNSLKRAIRNYKKRIKEHEEYISNPYEHCPDWDSFDDRKKEGLIRHWKKEISNFDESIQNRVTELKKRGDHDE